MNLKTLLAIILIGTGLVSFGLGLKVAFFDQRPPALSSLRVDSFPKTRVFLNDKELGQTPLLWENLTPAEYKIKLVPSGETGGTFVFWETKIKLTQGTLTYLSRLLGPSEEESSGQTLTLEKLPLESVQELAVISSPDQANVSVDGQSTGKTSLLLRSLSPGDHEIAVSLANYSDEVIHGRIIAGYRLNVVAKLSRLSKEMTASSSGQPTAALVSSVSGEITKPYVVIKETETGFLRVHDGPSLSATETARVKPGEKYPLLLEVSGWVKIKLPAIFGWVSSDYVEKVK